MVDGADALTVFVLECLTSSHDNGYPVSGLTAEEISVDIVQKTDTDYTQYQIAEEIERIRRVICL